MNDRDNVMLWIKDKHARLYQMWLSDTASVVYVNYFCKGERGYLETCVGVVLMYRRPKRLLPKWTKTFSQQVIGVSTLMLCSGFGDDTLTATDTMLRASRPMHSEGVEDLSGEVSDW